MPHLPPKDKACGTEVYINQIPIFYKIWIFSCVLTIQCVKKVMLVLHKGFSLEIFAHGSLYYYHSALILPVKHLFRENKSIAKPPFKISTTFFRLC